MTLWTQAEAAGATGGEARGSWAASGVSIDTRTIQPGDLFVALRAQRDGHDFVAAALEKGAAAALVTHRPEGVAEGAPLLVVADVQRALEDLGRAGRARARAKVVGITGSVGKTSTKEMMRAALGAVGTVHAAEASYNNHWGVPLTLARLPRGADFAVVEIGMNHRGEIAPLARQARPHVALITTIGPAHLEALGSIEEIAREKGDICEGLEPGGVAVLPADVPQIGILRAAAERVGARVETFGTAEAADWRIVEMGPDGMGQPRTAVQVDVGGKSARFLVSGGRHFAVNATGVLAAVEVLGVDMLRSMSGLEQWSPPAGRGGREEVTWTGGAVSLVDDAFNANPTSMTAGLAALAALPWQRRANGPIEGRRVAILGDMLELGPEEAAMHAALARDPSMGGVAVVHCVGPRMRALHEALPDGRRGLWAERPEGLEGELRDLLRAGDVVLVKGSKGSRVSRLVDAIRRIGQEARPAETTDGA